MTNTEPNNLLENIKAEATKRKTWVTPGSDPTQVVEWTIYGTNADGTIDRVNYLVITEFQGVYVGEFFPGKRPSLPDLSVVIEKIHQQLEERWEEKDSGPRMWE